MSLVLRTILLNVNVNLQPLVKKACGNMLLWRCHSGSVMMEMVQIAQYFGSMALLALARLVLQTVWLRAVSR